MPYKQAKQSHILVSCYSTLEEATSLTRNFNEEEEEEEEEEEFLPSRAQRKPWPKF